MAVRVDRPKRIFKLDGRTLADPDPNLDVEAVRRFFAAQPQYAVLTTAEYKGPTQEGRTIVHEFSTKVRVKG